MSGGLEPHIPEEIPRLNSIEDLRAMNEERIRRMYRKPADDAAEQMRAALRDGVLTGIGDTITRVFQGLNPREGYEPIADGMAEIKNRTDVIDEILDLGIAYMPAGTGFSGTGRLPFSQQRGAAKGVEFVDNGIRLLGRGSWQISVEVRPDFLWSGTPVANNRVEYEVRCYRPDGSIYTFQRYYVRDWDSESKTFGADFSVPEPGYFVSVHVIYVGAFFRGHLGGWAVTRLVAKRWTSDHLGPPTGGAEDDVSDGTEP